MYLSGEYTKSISFKNGHMSHLRVVKCHTKDMKNWVLQDKRSILVILVVEKGGSVTS